MMQINDLLNMEWDEDIDWLIDNQDGYSENKKLEEENSELLAALEDGGDEGLEGY